VVNYPAKHDHPSSEAAGDPDRSLKGAPSGILVHQETYFSAFFFAAQRFFIISEIFFRPAALIPPFLRLGAACFAAVELPFCFAQRFFCASEILRRAAALMWRRPVFFDLSAEALPPNDSRAEIASLMRSRLARRSATILLVSIDAPKLYLTLWTNVLMPPTAAELAYLSLVTVSSRSTFRTPEMPNRVTRAECQLIARIEGPLNLADSERETILASELRTM